MTEITNPRQAFELMGIPELHDRAFHSNSHGELFHMMDYIQLARYAVTNRSVMEGMTDDIMEMVSLHVMGAYITSVIEWTDANWERPDSAFQHMPRLVSDMFSLK